MSDSFISSSLCSISTCSTSSLNLYSVYVNYENQLDSCNSDMVKSVERNDLFTWDERLRFPIVKKESISPIKNGFGIKVINRSLITSDEMGMGMASPTSKRSRNLTSCTSTTTTTTTTSSKCLEDRVNDWVKKKVENGVPEIECCLPFLDKAPKLVECRVCSKYIYSDKVLCSVSGCQQSYHLQCAKETLGFSHLRSFKCPQHGCFLCKQKGWWKCIRCTMAAHSKCAPWPDRVMHTNKPRQAVCWRHPTNWRLEKKVKLFFPLKASHGKLPMWFSEKESF
ncbi:hypothetical protein IFM89_026477 [Coptis chinensis]|uniref:Zinc finger PHD-type domain-containing protein n=1 Tax=Coptis chinensis TaxID=261450 RepID=A0A835M9N3_9MAGN|nr:hypothetical protein IFM89_026477 [Coptis chinensis]